MEPVHTLGGHPIYEAMSEENALKITQTWKAGGKWGQKPRFRFKLENPTEDTGLYSFKEIETDATRKSGFRFKNVDTLASTAAKYRGLKKGGGITDQEIFNIYQKNFPEAPKKEINKLVEFFQKQNKIKEKELPLQRIEYERLYGTKFATDHVEALASGEKYTDVFTNKKNIEDQINAFKSDKKGSKEFRAFLTEQGIDTADNRILRGLYSDIVYDKPGSMAWNEKMAEFFPPDSPTGLSLKAKIAKGVSKTTSATSSAEALLLLGSGNVVPGSVALAMQTPAVQKQVAKKLIKPVSKFLAKQGLKMIPGVSLGSGILQGVGYLASGQYSKAALSAAGGVIGEFGPVGDAVQAMIDLGLTAHDIKTTKVKPKSDVSNTTSTKKITKSLSKLK